MNKTSRILRFGLVGSAPALIHILVVWMLVLCGVHPLLGNIVGFLVAFQASYFGHCFVTFGGKPDRRSYARMFLVAGMGLVVNEVAYGMLLHFTDLDYRISLAAVLVLVAAGTYVTCSSWVFRNRKKLGIDEDAGKRSFIATDINESKKAWYFIMKGSGFE